MVTFCPTCAASLIEINDATAVIAESSVFKKNSYYVMCKRCGHLFILNGNRKMLFDIDDFKDDPVVLTELNKALNQMQKEKEEPKESPIKQEIEEKCAHDCSSCSNDCASIELKEDILLLVGTDGSAEIVCIDDLHRFDLDKYQAYALQPVRIEPIVTYKVHKM